jgi:hypothetical protein
MELPEHVPWILEDVAVGVATELVATRASLPLAAAVLLPGVARSVEPVAVELDGQSTFGPAAVDAPPACRPVRLGEFKSRRRTPAS